MHRQNDWKNIKWSLAVLALGGVLFGCAGNTIGGAGTSATTATTATTGGIFSEVAGVNLSDTPALLEYGFLTGAGRAGDSKKAKLRNLIVSDIFGSEASGLTGKTLTITQYESQLLSTNTGLAGQQSRLFTSIQLNVNDYTETVNGLTQSFSSINNIPNDISASLRVFKGRHTIIPMYLDPDTFVTEVVNVGGTDVTQAKFDRDWFDVINKIDGDTVSVRGFLSDYVCFDVSAISSGDLPSLSQANGTANRIFFSGDGFALGAGDPINTGSTGAPFELILQDGQGASVIGRYSAPTPLGGAVTPGTYTTRNIDPSDVTTTDPIMARKITSFQGTWKYHFDQKPNPISGVVEDLGYLKNVHAFEAVSIPTSLDDERQQVVMFAETISTVGGIKTATITKMMWGYLDLATKKVFVYPLTNLTDIDAQTNRDGEIAGTIGTMYTSTGAPTVSPQQMRFAEFSLPGAPSGFATSGKIVVLRR